MTFDEDVLISTARTQESLTDWGEMPDTRMALHLLSSATSGMTNLGRRLYGNMIVETLKSRLRINNQFRMMPAYAYRSIHNPIFIASLPRSGTTLLHNLLALDKNAQYVHHWDALNISKRNANIETLRYMEQQILNRMYESYPKLKTIHYQEADGPEECIHLMKNTFLDPIIWYLANGSMFYYNWVLNREMSEAYAMYKRQLQVLKTYEPSKHWVLKSSSHCYNMDVLADTFPNGMFIHINRPVYEILPSAVSLVREHRRMLFEKIDEELIINEVTGILIGMKNSWIETSRYIHPTRMMVIEYDDLVKDPIDMVRRIYAFYDLEITDEYFEIMAKYCEDNPKHKHGVHDYVS